jgi:hypothetical protein
MANRQVRRRLGEDEINRGVECWRLAVHKGTLPMSLGYLQDVKPIPKMTENVLQGHTGGRERSSTRGQDRFIVLQARR